jgi:transcription elongation GreA/GreB family factor
MLIPPSQLVPKRLSTQKKLSKISMGSFVKTKQTFFYISIGFGKISVMNETVFCISPIAPLGQLFLGKKIGEEVIFNQQVHSILEIE